jgi:hemerythrin-like domain-containing protein
MLEHEKQRRRCMSKAVEDLRHEHEAILSALRILDGITALLKKGAAVEVGDLLGFVGFFTEFADKCHHGKEEGILFPALSRAGIPQKGGSIEVMLAEHAQGRELIKTMKSAVEKTPDFPIFTQAAGEYSNLMRNHIRKENTVLFPAVENALTGPQLEHIYESFEEHEEKVIGQGRHEQLRDLLKGLQRKYAAP